MQQIFGKDNFFIEIQLIDSDNNETSRTTAEKLRQISIKTGIPCVATPDAHYATREAAEDQQILFCTSLKKNHRTSSTRIKRRQIQVSRMLFFFK